MTTAFRWERLGNIFNPQARQPHPWMMEYAQCPTPFVLDDATVRVYFATRPLRDGAGLYVSRPGFVDLDRRDLRRVVAVAERPALDLGTTGTFDEFGVMPSSVLRVGDAVYMYYTGWTRMASVPYTTAIGVAVSRDGGTTFERLGDGPVLNIALDEPLLVNSPIVRILGGTWHMWYITGRRWVDGEAGPEIVFQHAHATSSDGLAWDHRETGIMPTVLGDDECHDLLCPVFIDGRWHAFFAYRHATGFRDGAGRGYRLGHAVSDDLRTWRRDDGAAAFPVSAEGWDSAMVCSTQFLEADGRRWMFYCGNGIGRGGFGAAELIVTPPATPSASPPDSTSSSR